MNADTQRKPDSASNGSYLSQLSQVLSISDAHASAAHTSPRQRSWTQSDGEAIEVRGIDHINVSVRDLNRSIDFYSKVFGFEIKEDRRDGPRPYVILGSRDVAYLALHQRDPDTKRHRTLSNHGGINHWGFFVGDLSAVLRKLSLHGIRPQHHGRSKNGVYEYPSSRSVYVKDPDGHEMELTEVFGGGLR